MAGLADRVSANRIVNNDGTIDVQSTTVENPETHEQEAATDVSVVVKSGEKVIAVDQNHGGLYTDIKVIKLIPSGTAGANEEVDANLGSNVREAYKLLASDGQTQLGHRIDIYKDSALTNVYLGTMGDSLSGQDAQTGESASSTVVNGTGSESLNFIYHLENGNYKMEKVDVETFLQESEFGDGLDVNSTTHVVSVKVDPSSESVITAYGSPNTTAPVLSVGANGISVDNIQDAIDAAVAHGGTSIINSTMTALSDGTVSVVNTNQGNVNHIAIKQGTDASGGKTYEFLENDIASKAALDAEVTRAQNAEGEIAGLVGLGGTEGSRTYTPVVTPETGETAATTVKEDIALLDAHVDALNTALTGLDSSAGPTADSALAGFVQVDGKVYGAMTTMPQVTEGVSATSESNSSNAYIKITKTNAQAATISADGRTLTNGTGASYAIATTQALDDAIAAATSEVVGEADAAHADPNTAENGVYVTPSTDATDNHTVYTVAIDVFDCGEYTVS